MNKLKICDLNFCKTVSDSQVKGAYGSGWWLASYIRSNLEPTVSYREDGLAIQAYQSSSDSQEDGLAIQAYRGEDNYAFIGSSPDGQKQIIGIVGLNARGGSFAISRSRITSR